MRHEGTGSERGWSEAEFARRAEPEELPEWMDEPCSTEVLAACLGDLAGVNRMTMSYRPTLEFLGRVAKVSGGRPLHVVDVGSGYGDMLREIWRWARRRRLEWRLTGVELNAQTTEIAMRATRDEGIEPDAIAWTTGDAMAEEAGLEPDLVVSSLVTHHLSHGELVRFVGWMEGSARVGWFVNDLERRRGPARMFAVLARVMGWHAFVRHDGPVSFRRAFRAEDWERILREAGVAAGAARVARFFPARLCVERMR